MQASFYESIREQQESGLWLDVVGQVDQMVRLASMLDHYMSTAERLPTLIALKEREFNVPIPSRTGQRGSSRYRFQGFIDGWTEDERGRWLVEFKLRGRLTAFALLQLSRQVRWYAWAMQRESGGEFRPVGVVVDERLNEEPKPPKILKSGKPSHDKAQVTTPEWYIAVCEEHDVEPHDDVVEALGQREWQKRHWLPLRPSEIDEAGEELVSEAKKIGQYDRGELFPTRNAQPFICERCKFKKICDSPRDDLYVDTLFSRGLPKRDRVAATHEQHHPTESQQPVGALTTVAAARHEQLALG
jgi:hypothetical protein